MTLHPGMRAVAQGSRETVRFARLLARNLAQGCRLALGLPRPRFAASVGQLLALLVLGWTCALLADWRAAEAPVRISAWGVATEAARAYWWLALLAVTGLLNGRPGRVLAVLVACAAAEPLLWAFWFATLSAWPWLTPRLAWPWQDITWWCVLAWQVFILARALSLESPRFRWRMPALAAFYAAGLYVSVEYLPDQALLVPADPGAATPPLDVEATYYAQAGLLGAALADVGPGRPGVPDFYFLGFGAYADEAVFRREVAQVRRIVGRRLDAETRALTLVNSPGTLRQYPLANRSNLEYVLHELARRMEREQDILFLFMTSHGTEAGELVVDFGELGLNDLRPGELREMLDRAGIGWRVLVVSACYSGAFVPALRERRTLVITAAASDRSSFGCAHENEWTYFGEAFFRDALAGGGSLVEAFERARAAIESREAREGKEASRPQMSVGRDIEAHLARWAASR